MSFSILISSQNVTYKRFIKDIPIKLESILLVLIINFTCSMSLETTLTQLTLTLKAQLLQLWEYSKCDGQQEIL